MQPIFSITLNGEASEALEFYQDVFHTKTGRAMRYGDLPAAEGLPEAMKKLVVHGELEADGFVLFVSDSQPGVVMTGGNKASFVITDTGDGSVERITAIYKKLLRGGKALLEMEPVFYAEAYAWVEDKYGVHWQLMANRKV